MTDSAERLEREAFEAWARTKGFDTTLKPYGYESLATEAAHMGWTEAFHAARRAPAEAGAPSGWNALTDEDRQAAFESLPDMLEGFMKKWGWLHFAKEIERRCREKNDATRDGWKLVPEILTTEMHNAAVKKDNEALDDSGKPASIEGLWLAMLAAAPAAPKAEKCWCQTCRPITMEDMRMVLCPTCGNKRCPRANDHRNVCTGSNEAGQPGSAYPKQEKA